jgi:hypothetical protein
MHNAVTCDKGSKRFLQPGTGVRMLETGPAFGLTSSITNLKDLLFLLRLIEQQIFHS